ncbi:MAG: hypothetical protein ACYCS7_00655 [Acidimicrobiales bacterium]
MNYPPNDLPDGDHAQGLELQIEELVEQRSRAEAQDNASEVVGIDRALAMLYDELAETAERSAKEQSA